jgi:hypothetical protein
MYRQLAQSVTARMLENRTAAVSLKNCLSLFLCDLTAETNVATGCGDLPERIPAVT